MIAFTHRLRLQLAAHERHIAAFLLLVMAMFSIVNWVTLPRYSGLDFCQFWGIAQSQRQSGFTLGNPYRHPEGYERQIAAIERASTDSTFADANHLRESLDLTGTPLLYAAFDPLPADYRLSLWLYRIIQFVAFMVSLYVLARPRFGAWRPLTLLCGILLAISYDPLSFDLKVGNVNCLQLLGLIVCIALAGRLSSAASRSQQVASLALGALATLLAMLKPNLGLPLLLLAVGLLLRAGVRVGLMAAVAALPTGVALASIAAHYFGGWQVWPDWWRSTFRSVGRLSYPIGTGNRSMSLYLAQQLDVGTAGVMQVTGAAMLLSLLAMPALTAAPGTSRWRSWAGGIAARLADPQFGVGLGIVLTYAVSPLVWPHYFVLGLIPAFGLIRDRPPLAAERILGFLALLMMGGLPEHIHAIVGRGSESLMTAARVLAWTPLWLGLLVAAARRRAMAASESTPR